jgi:methyl-accepting chemotaxis protein
MHNGQKIGGWFEVKDDTSVYDQMVAKLKELGAEHIKVDRVRKIATGTIRHNNRTVSDLTVKYDELSGALGRYQKQERESLTGLPAFLNGFQKKFNSIMQYLTMTMSIHQVLSQLRRGVQYVKEIDLALTELKKVTNETKETYDEFLETASKTAEKVGSTIQKVVSSTADWARLGYSIAEAHELAESTQVLMNVSEFTDVNQATDSLISSIQAFKYTAEESMGVVDILNTIGKQYCRDRIVIYGQADNYNGQRLGIVQTVERLCYKQYKMIRR